MSRDRSFILLAIVLLLSQMIGITKRSFWADEAYVGLVVNEPWQIFLRKLDTDIHHPLYIVVMKIWGMAAGNSEFALRFFSVLALVAGFRIFWSLVSETDREVAARWTAVLFIFSPLVLLYGRMARYYSLSLLLYVLALWLVDRWERHPRGSWAVYYYFVMSASWYLTEPLGVIGATHFLLFPRGSRMRPKVVAVWALSFMTYAIWFWVWRDKLWAQLESPSSPLTFAFYREWGLKMGFTLYESLFGETVPAVWVIGFTAVVALILGILGFRRPVPRYLLFTLIWLPAMTALATYPIRVGTDFVPARVFFLVPGLYWLLGRGVAGFRRALQAPVALLLLSPVAVGMGFTYERAHSLTSTYVTPWRELTRKIMRSGRPEDWVLADEVPLLYYRERFGGGGPRAVIVTQDTDIEALMDTLSAEFPPRIYVIFNPKDITGGKITTLLEWLELGYDRVKAVPVVTEAPQVSQLKNLLALSGSPVKRELRIYHNIQILADPFAIDLTFKLPEIPVLPERETNVLSDKEHTEGSLPDEAAE